MENQRNCMLSILEQDSQARIARESANKARIATCKASLAKHQKEFQEKRTASLAALGNCATP